MLDDNELVTYIDLNENTFDILSIYWGEETIIERELAKSELTNF